MALIIACCVVIPSLLNSRMIVIHSLKLYSCVMLVGFVVPGI